MTSRPQAWPPTPVLIDDLPPYLPAGTVRLAVEPHRIADAEPVLDRHCARAGKRAVPAHRIAERRDDIELVAVDAEIIQRGRGVDHRRRDVAAHRSAERRVGQKCDSTCSSRWLPYH